MSSRVTTRGSKLSRKRAAPTETPNPLDESSDDFQSPKMPATAEGKRKDARPPPSKKSLKENAPPPPPESSLAIAEDPVPNCPLCGKSFKAGQKLPRASHLKSCAAKHGVTTDTLLKLRQLEEKQAEERKALGLPALPASTEDTKNKTANNTTSRTGSRTKGAALLAPSGGEDPHLEMAIALSASLAHEKHDQEVEERQHLESLGLLDPQPSTSAASLVPPPKKKEKLPEVLLPQATTWIAPQSAATTKRPGKTTAKTQLQVRTEADRDRMVSERVAAILARESTTQTCSASPWKSDFTTGVPIGRSLVRGSLLKDNLNGQQHFWTTAAGMLPDEHYLSTIILPFLEKTKQISKNVSIKETKEEPPFSGSKDKEQLSKHLFTLLQAKKRCDTVIHCKDGHTSECHYLILLARCPKALEDAIQEDGDDTSRERFLLSWYHATKSAVDLFLQFVYSAELGEVKTRVELKTLKEFSRAFGLDGLQAALKNVNMFGLMSGEEEEETNPTLLVDDDQALNDEVSENDFSENGPRYGEQALIGATQKLDMLLDELESRELEEEEEATKEEEESECESDNGSEDQNALEFEGEFHTQNTHENVKKSSVDVPSSPAKKDATCNDEEMFGNSDDDLFGGSMIEDAPEEHVDQEEVISVSSGKPSSQICFSEELPTPEKCESINATVVDESLIQNSPLVENLTPGSPPDLGGPKDQEEEEDVWANYYDDPVDLPEEVPPPPPPAPAVATPPCPPPTSTPKLSEQHRPPPSRGGGDAPVTPMPNYESMLSPALRGELKKFGLKAIPRRKAVQILHHIYEEMHPEVMESNAEEPEEASEMTSSQASTSSSTFGSQDDDDGTNMPEESILAIPFDEDEDEVVPASQAPSEQDLEASVKAFIRGNKELYNKVLTYDPIWLEDFVADFKAETKIKCNVNQIMDLLDNECVTFRTRARSQRTQRTQRKKSSPKKKKRKIPKKKTATQA